MNQVRSGIIILILLPSLKSYGVSYSVSGSADNKNLGFYKQQSRSGRVGVDFEISKYYQLGLSHSQQIELRNGYKTDEDQSAFQLYESTTNISTNTVNVTLTPFHGTFAPFAFAGIGIYHVVKNEIVNDQVDFQDDTYPGPQGGLGLRIAVSKRFAIRLTHTVSMGSFKTPTDTKGSFKANGRTQMGVSFHP